MNPWVWNPMDPGELTVHLQMFKGLLCVRNWVFFYINMFIC
jgi:hypothetical protein